jgi:hypothetical protein
MHHCVGWLQEIGVGKSNMGCCRRRGLLLTGRPSLIYGRKHNGWSLLDWGHLVCSWGSLARDCRHPVELDWGSWKRLLFRAHRSEALCLPPRRASFIEAISILLLRAHRSEALRSPRCYFICRSTQRLLRLMLQRPLICTAKPSTSATCPSYNLRTEIATILIWAKQQQWQRIWGEEYVLRLRSTNMLHWLLNKDGDVKYCPFDYLPDA